MTAKTFWKMRTSPQCGRNYVDRSKRGHGNKAARRAIRTQRGAEHIEFSDEPIYTDRPEILNRGAGLMIIDRYPHMRDRINQDIR